MYMGIYIYREIHVCIYRYIYSSRERDTHARTNTHKRKHARTHARTHTHTHTHTDVHASVRRCRTGGGGGGAQQLRVRVAGADRVRVEPRIAVGGEVVAAPRGGRAGHHGSKRLARGGSGGAARRLGHDPHGARRAHVAARGAGHVRACAPQHRTRARPHRPCRRSRARQ